MNLGIVRATRGRVVLAGVVVSVAFLSSGCGSVAVNQMLTQAQKGIAAGKNNDNLLVEKIRKEIQTEITQLNKAVDRDVEMLQAGAIKDANGNAVPLDAEWVKQMRVGYFLALQSKYKELERLQQVQAAIDGNTNMVSRLVDESKKLNMGYITTFNGVGLLINQLNTQDAVDVSEIVDTTAGTSSTVAGATNATAEAETTETTTAAETQSAEQGE